jgi:ABC-type sugar transport system ATPase subunit
MSDRIGIMRNGRIEQIGAPDELSSCNVFVAVSRRVQHPHAPSSAAMA